jgi:hypothetical protein
MQRLDCCRHGRILVAAAVAASLATVANAASESAVTIERVPDGGIQPQLAVASDGVAHLVYFKGEPRAGDLFYCRRAPDEARFSRPIRVNSVPASAIAVGTIRGAQISLGKNNRVHVAWNGSDQATPKGPKGETPLVYTRLTDAGDAFEPQRNLIQNAYGLDGGACIAADPAGSVYVVWHAGDGAAGEASRRVWLRKSTDDGATFDAERPIDVAKVGVCGCCGMRGSVTPAGEVQFLYRSARDDVHRDMYLLTSSDRGESFTSRKLQGWEVSTCPMSSADFAHFDNSTWAGWETDGQVYFVRLGKSGGEEPGPIAPGGTSKNRKHPRLVIGDTGTVLTIWTEGTGWNRGGDLAWQLTDAEGRITLTKGRQAGIPVWSFASGFQKRDGSFVILH